MTVHDSCTQVVIRDPLEIVRCKSPGKMPFVRLKFSDGKSLDISINLAERIGLAASDARMRLDLAYKRVG